MSISINIRRDDTVSAYAMRHQHWTLCLPVPQHLIRYIVRITDKKENSGRAEEDNQVTDSLVFLHFSSQYLRCRDCICDTFSCLRLKCIGDGGQEIHGPDHSSYINPVLGERWDIAMEMHGLLERPVR
jgi:hypothetical protein